MHPSTSGRCTVLVTLSLAQVGDRVVISGSPPDIETARLAGALQAAGIAARLHSASGPRTLRGLARGLAARDPEAVLVRIADPALLALAGAWIGALRAECPDARIILLAETGDAAALNVDARLAIDDEPALVELLKPRAPRGTPREVGHAQRIAV